MERLYVATCGYDQKQCADHADFVNKLVEIMSPGQQNYFLNGIKNTIVLAIIRHTNIDPSKLELALDYASQKEVDRIMEEKENAKGNIA